MKNYTEKEKKEIVEDYFSRFKDEYSEVEKERLAELFGTSSTDAVTQIYHAMDLYDKKENPYNGFADIIEKRFGLDHNILEIGGGVYPALTEVISKRQVKIGKGTITVYDPRVAANKIKLERATLKQANFTRNIDLSKYDLIIGKEPCGATTTLINVALETKKSYLVSPCKCYGLLPSYMDFGDDPIKQWYGYVKYLCKCTDQQVKTDYLPKVMKYEAPIYTTKVR